MKKFLNKFMEDGKSFTSEDVEHLRQQFNLTIKKVKRVFNKMAFRKLYAAESDDVDLKLNRSVMDVIMTSFELYEYDQIEEKRKAITNGFIDLIANDEEYYDALSTATSDANKLNYRLNRWHEKMQEIMG